MKNRYKNDARINDAKMMENGDDLELKRKPKSTQMWKKCMPKKTMPKRSQILHPLLERFLYVFWFILGQFFIVFRMGDGFKIGAQALPFCGAALQRQAREKQKKHRSMEYKNP